MPRLREPRGAGSCTVPTLSTLSEREVGKLLDLGVATVVDLRNARELDTSPGVFAAHARVQYHHNAVALLDDADLPPHERLLALNFSVHNVDMARRSGETFAFLFHLLAREETDPWCSAAPAGATAPE